MSPTCAAGSARLSTRLLRGSRSLRLGRREGFTASLFVICNILYYGWARHLPFSSDRTRSGRGGSRHLLCRRMFRSCGLNVNVERGALINSGDMIDIGDNSGIGLNAFVLGPLIIGRNVMMGPNCTLLGVNHEVSRTDIPMVEQGDTSPAPPIIEDDVWLGAGVIAPPRTPGRHRQYRRGWRRSQQGVAPYTIVGGEPGDPRPPTRRPNSP